MAGSMPSSRPRPALAAEPSPRSRRARGSCEICSRLLLTALALLPLACTSSGAPDSIPPQTLAAPPENPETSATAPAPTSVPPPATTPEPAPAPTPAPPAAVSPDASAATAPPADDDDRSITRIPGPSDPSAPAEELAAGTVHLGASEAATPVTSRDLVTAAMEERARRRDRAPTRVVITDKNLDTLASRGTLTESDEPPATPGAAPAAPIVGVAGGREESWWRQEARRLREAWSNAVRQVELSRTEADRLRTRFYSEDDPFVRDGQIKPAWDRALDRLTEALERVETSQSALEQFLEDGHRAGALPGWLREGIELEPPVRKDSSPSSPAPAEPVQARENG
jgi:hypothetical protein